MDECSTNSEQQKEDWMNTKWRPAMGWMYMAVCVTDFIIFPILWSVAQVYHGGRVDAQWAPITLQGAGLFHMAMGAVLGLAAWGRTQEKLVGVADEVIRPKPKPAPAPVPELADDDPPERNTRSD